ncbi:MAG: acetoin utilization protein AcuC [Planctomycetota bacterium]
MRAAFIHSAEIEKYRYPPTCPFRTERAGLTRARLRSMGLLGGPDRRETAPEPASREAIERFHAPRYLDALLAAEAGDLDIEALGMGLATEDCPIFRGMYEYAALACGASVLGAELLLAGEADVVFNPSGGYHHAHAARAGGFCYLNDVVLACERLVRAGKRVAFLDVDVHHPDGVQDAFYDRSDVLVVSFHQDPKTLFPWTGKVEEAGVGAGTGYTVNVPLPVGTYDEAFLRSFRAVFPPLVRAYRPDVVVVEIGMDMLSGDPLANLALTNNAYAEVLEFVVGLGLPILATGGGGYHVENTVRGWALAWSILCGELAASDDMSLGLGGVLLETTDWRGGLRDRILVPDARRREEIEPAIDETIAAVQRIVFPHHGL